jgi:hypothetical protein
MGPSLNEIDKSLRSLPNMKSADTWYFPFETERPVVTLTHPLFVQKYKDMVPSPELRAIRRDDHGSEVSIPWDSVAAGTIVRVKVGLSYPSLTEVQYICLPLEIVWRMGPRANRNRDRARSYRRYRSRDIAVRCRKRRREPSRGRRRLFVGLIFLMCQVSLSGASMKVRLPA